MTYILGLKQPGINAILSDSRISWKGKNNQWEGDNTALKTGLFFTGCIFGRVGSSEHSQQFISRFKASIDSTSDDTELCWTRLQDYVLEYPFSSHPDNHFQLLLSTRVNGIPEFFIIDSQTGMSKQSTSDDLAILTLGSGKEILDAKVYSEFLPRMQMFFQEFLIERKVLPSVEHARYITLYLTCLWLSELSLTYESSLLHNQQVGGVFHFICQHERGEETQKPAVYIFSSGHRKSSTIFGWIYRVAFVHGGLYVEIHHPNSPLTKQPRTETEKYIFFDVASSPSIDGLSTKELMSRTKKEISNLPFFFFCGFGFTPPEDRRSFGFVISEKGSYEELFNADGSLKEDYQKLIASNF